MLLAIESHIEYLNDDTVEGACVLMNKVGYLVDEKIKKIEYAKEAGDAKLKKTDIKNVMKFRLIFSRFEELANDE